MKTFHIDTNVISGQQKTCALVIQVRYTRFLWCPKWAFKRDCALLSIKIAAPKHDPVRGFRCVSYGAAVKLRSLGREFV